MRLLVYNIAYGTGGPNNFYHRLWTVHRYVRTSQSHLDRIIRFIDESNADIVGLVEVDTGSYRTKRLNQVHVVASHLQHYHHSSNKYGDDSLGSSMPFLKHQANAILTRENINNGHFHYFPVGFKKLILEVEIRGIRIFLVHLALKQRIREKQIEHLAELAYGDDPVIIAGDFNTFKGASEIEELQRYLDLTNPNSSHLPTYPSWNPKRQLDFVLCSQSIKVTDFQVGKVKFSDHLPLIMDFEA